jgi:uncharacterized protein YndB with AHSA1/START domain
MTSTESDRIERTVLIQAPRERVWRALSDAEEFGGWFRVNLKGQVFAPGRRARGNITHPGYEHVMFDILVQEMDPGRRMSWLWHPYAVEPGVDYSPETPTLVTFTLEDAPGGGTLLKVVESGFDHLPPHRRSLAFRMNSDGWNAQMVNIQSHAGQS